MAFPIMMIAAMALQKKQEEKEKERARRDAISQLHQQRAGELGHPTYAIDAQRTARGINEAESDGDDFMAQWIEAEEQKAAQRRAQG